MWGSASARLIIIDEPLRLLTRLRVVLACPRGIAAVFWFREVSLSKPKWPYQFQPNPAASGLG